VSRRRKDTAIKADLVMPAPRYWATEFLYTRHHRPPLAVIGD